MKFVLRSDKEITKEKLIDLGFDGLMKRGDRRIILHSNGEEVELTENPEEATGKALVLKRPNYKVKAKYVILEYIPSSIREIHQFKVNVIIDGINDVALYPKIESMKPWGIITEDENYVQLVKKIISKAK
jgi:hypothetical protein